MGGDFPLGIGTVNGKAAIEELVLTKLVIDVGVVGFGEVEVGVVILLPVVGGVFPFAVEFKLKLSLSVLLSPFSSSLTPFDSLLEFVTSSLIS